MHLLRQSANAELRDPVNGGSLFIHIHMKLALVCFLLFIIQTSGKSQPEFNKPWVDSASAIIIDPYYQNHFDFNLIASDPKLVAIIHKASGGLKADDSCETRKVEALRRGYLWGSYHLGKPGDPVKQADFYLACAKPDTNEVMALDIEDTDRTRAMSIPNTIKFIKRIKEKTGRYPLLYVNNDVCSYISKHYSTDTTIANCKLWYARFTEKFTALPVGIWSKYTLWQFCSEINCKRNQQCLYTIPGTRYDMDVNVYHGTKSELKEKWPFDD
jgi:GH25 family lysozyme M1 (1,4-beta-N-acetylmuramidase)